MTPQELLERMPPRKKDPNKLPGKVITWVNPNLQKNNKNEQPPEPEKVQPKIQKSLPKQDTNQPKVPTRNRSVLPTDDADTEQPPKQKSLIARGIDSSGEINHDYFTGYLPPQKAAGEDEADDWKPATSTVADKSKKVLRGSGGDNSILANELGERYYIRSFFSFPMINDPAYQVYNQKSPIEKALYLGLKSAISNKNFSTANKGSNDKIQFDSAGTLKGAIQTVSNVIKATMENFTDEYHHLYEKQWPIVLINPEDINSSSARTFAISHWVKIPPDTTLENADAVEHYFFGFIDTAGISTNAAGIKKQNFFSSFTVGRIEEIIKAYGIGAKALKRISGLSPSRVLNINGNYDNKGDIDGLDYTVEGKILDNPWQQIKQSIKTSFARSPKKSAKLLEITDAIIGDSAGQASKYPIKLEGISYKDNGFSTNAVTVDFMEILHPLVAMKPNGVMNNGLYNAARTYLGTKNKSGKVEFNLQDCAVGYPDAANAKLFDSVLINKKTKARLLISSKDGEGATPSAASLGAVYNLFEKNLDFFSSANAEDAELGEFIMRLMGNAPEEFREMLKFMSALTHGTPADTIQYLMPSSGAGKRIAELLLIKGKQKSEAIQQAAAMLNTWNGGNRFSNGGKGEFLEFCSGVMRFTPLVQISTINRKEKPEVDRADDIIISGFLATWPNKIFDDISFHEQASLLRFKIGVGGGTGNVSVRQPNKDGERVYKTEPRFDKFKARDYSGKMSDSMRFTYTSKINKMIVPGFGKSWNVLVNNLSKEFEKIIDFANGNNDRLLRTIRTNDNLLALYNSAIKFNNEHGYDPGMSTIPEYTVRDLLNTIHTALRGQK